MTAFNYTIKGYDADRLQLHVSFDDVNRFIIVQLQDPLPRTPEELDGYIRAFAPPLEVVQSINLDHRFVDEMIAPLVGSTRQVELVPTSRIPEEPIPEEVDIEAAQDAYIAEIVARVLAEKGLV